MIKKCSVLLVLCCIASNLCAMDSDQCCEQNKETVSPKKHKIRCLKNGQRSSRHDDFRFFKMMFGLHNEKDVRSFLKEKGNVETLPSLKQQDYTPMPYKKEIPNTLYSGCRRSVFEKYGTMRLSNVVINIMTIVGHVNENDLTEYQLSYVSCLRKESERMKNGEFHSYSNNNDKTFITAQKRIEDDLGNDLSICEKKTLATIDLKLSDAIKKTCEEIKNPKVLFLF
jgi:hypothetical protein